MGNDLKLLMIEDSHSHVTDTVEDLRCAGFNPLVTLIKTPSEMELALKGQAWDLIISDSYLSKFDALEALTLLGNSGLEIPFIILSKSLRGDVAIEALKKGAKDFLLKEKIYNSSKSLNIQSDKKLTVQILIYKPFLLLAGISGTGKTRFVREQAKLAGAFNDTYCLTSVRPDWHEPSDLLGYISIRSSDWSKYT